MFLEVVGFLGKRVQNAQLGYVVGKSLNRQWFKSFCNFEVSRVGIRAFYLLQVFDVFLHSDNCCCRATGLVSKGAAYWVWGVFITSLRLYIFVWR